MRVNVVPVSELCDQHLLAEHKSIPKIPNGLIAGKLSFEYGDRPFAYTVGEGHLKFFTNKLRWLFVRYLAVHAECEARGLDVPYQWPDGNYLLQHRLKYWNDYHVTNSDMIVNRRAIRYKLPSKAEYSEHRLVAA